jgi:metal transporter CNNM
MLASWTACTSFPREGFPVKVSSAKNIIAVGVPGRASPQTRFEEAFDPPVDLSIQHECNPMSLTHVATWLGIVACIIQSALFSVLNLAVFSLSLLRLQVEADGGNADAARVLDLRKGANQVLATIIWGNVTTNVLLTLLSDSVLAGIGAFVFSTFAITLLGEIFPQAYFSRNALQMTARFSPFLQFYRIFLYPLAKPTAMLLDLWLGVEGVAYLRERDIRLLIARHVAGGGDISKVEATGAQNFLDLDDVAVCDEGELVAAQSILKLPIANQRCVLPRFTAAPDDPFLRQVDASGMKWVIITDLEGEPTFVLDAHHFLRDALFNQLESDPTAYWHRPIIVRDMRTRLGDVISCMTVTPEQPGDDVIKHDLILVWGPQKRIITGSDLLGRLLRGIATVEKRAA